LLARFNRLEDRLIRRADEFTAEADLTGPDDLETALVDLDRELAVERELAALKAE
jgi:phage shock protein A